LEGGEDLKKDRDFAIRGLQTELKVLHPLTEFKFQTEENSETLSQLCVKERVRGLVLVVLRLATRRWCSHGLP
jgi:hypothetical protein